MNKNKKMYIAPTIEELVIELEQGIAAGSGNSQSGVPSATDIGDGSGGQDWDADSF